eukprot:TRINITY_DN3050_c0_g2_i1.p1 TRINITY_DN3050_c0_g2~~TRINITY_DN3050_c0_g2_i1.p1  ORF type:complete len:1121 (-),score=117.99 TRINITY_DN3050_c0_g2_i1:73-3102(-)
MSESTTSDNSSDPAIPLPNSNRKSGERIYRRPDDREESDYDNWRISTPRLEFTPEADKGVHTPKMGQLTIDQLLQPAPPTSPRDSMTPSTPLSPRSMRNRASVLYSVLPSHLEKFHNRTLKPSLRVWRPEAKDNVSSMLSLVPFFNETPQELYKTLQSMLKTHSYFVRKKSNVVVNGRHLIEPGGSCNLHVLVIQDGYRKACPAMNEWLRSGYPCRAWDYLEKLKNTVGGKAVEDKETMSWFCRATQKLFHDRPPGPSKVRNYTQTRSCGCCGHHNPIEVRVYCEKCGLHLSSDPLKEAVVTFQIVNAAHEVIPVTLENPDNPEETITITLTLIVKCRNRQKHDSHWWGLSKDNGFMSAYSQAEYGWLTDCGTLFHYKCLFHLMAAMQKPNIAAATGRQRVMSPSHQEGSEEGFVSRFLRHVQRCDFELSFGATMGSFAAFGFLPVLPGPCGFYRLDFLITSAQFYHEFLSMDVDDIGVIDANLMIAEDRVLSWAAFFEPVLEDISSASDEATCNNVMENLCWDPADHALEPPATYDGPTRKLKPKKEIHDVTIPRDVQTVLAPEAIFYFECETLMMSFVKQRRRWLNGTACGYLWLMYKRPFYPIAAPFVEEEDEEEEVDRNESIGSQDSESREDYLSATVSERLLSENNDPVIEIDETGEYEMTDSFGSGSSRNHLANRITSRWRSVQENQTKKVVVTKPEHNIPPSTKSTRWRWRIPWYRRIPIKILVAIQLWMNFWVYLAPAIFIIMFRYAMLILAFQDSMWSTYWWVALIVIYILFVFFSTRDDFYSWIFYVAMLFGFVIEGLSLGGITKSTYIYFALQVDRPENLTVINGTWAALPENMRAAPIWVVIPPLGMIGITLLLPLISSCLACPKIFTKFYRSSFWYIISSFIPYFLFLPTLVAVFGAFSLARLFDFTWGNRDSSGSTDKLGGRLDELQQRARFPSPFFLLINLAVVFIMADLSDVSPLVLLVFSCLLFGPVLLHFGLSFLYFLWWRLTLSCSNCCM